MRRDDYVVTRAAAAGSRGGETGRGQMPQARVGTAAGDAPAAVRTPRVQFGKCFEGWPSRRRKDVRAPAIGPRVPRNGAPARGRCKCRNSWGSCCPAPKSAATRGAGLGAASGVTTRRRPQGPQMQGAAGSVVRGTCPVGRDGCTAAGGLRCRRTEGEAARLFRALADCLDASADVQSAAATPAWGAGRDRVLRNAAFQQTHTRSQITVTPPSPKTRVRAPGVDAPQWRSV